MRDTNFLSKLRKILLDKERKTIKVQDLLDILGKDSIKVLMMMVTFITSLPVPPWGGGFETMPGGILCMYFSLQGLFGIDKVYIPDFIGQYEIHLKRIHESKYTEKTFRFIESWMQQNRIPSVFNPFTETLLYVLIIANAFLMVIPVVFTNGFPSQSITLLTLAWVLHDGLVFSIVFLLSILSLLMYTYLFFWASKFLYKTRKKWSFGML